MGFDVSGYVRYANPTYMAADKFKQLAGLVDEVFQLMPSGKHMVGRAS